ncbi:MAG: hypothetical protein J5857_09175 [Treponema sp.]|nr:hypothetical protein [Treponema sp.]
MIFRFATLADKSIIGSSYEEKVKNYCRNITIIWCLFFILNGTLSTLTAFSQNIFKITEEQADKIWTIYNGAISYILMGLLFAVEYLVRIIYDRHLIKTEPLSKLRLFSRKESHILCISKTDKTKKTWCDFLSETECLRNKYASTSDKQIILGKLNEWDFLINLCAVIQSKNIPVIDFSNSSTPEIDLTGIKKHSNDIPQIQSETAKIIIHQDENIKQTTLFEIEETINSIIKTNGNKLVLQKNPSTLIQNDAEKFLENLLLHFTLGLKFYSHRSDR